MEYDVIIVGAGPAGIFAALTLADLGITSVVLLEQGQVLELRERRNPGDMLCGWGGAGGRSGGGQSRQGSGRLGDPAQRSSG